METLERLRVALADRYSIERELGAGGMATVYLARDLKHDREVALKVLRAELAAVLGAERFLQEIRISARLDHPHILTLIDSGRAEGILYYVLPFVRGESLRTKLEREKQLPVGEALAITRQVASALDYAHRRGIIHRDIKPENILIHEGEAVVADFGIALALREAGGVRLTEAGLSLGTPHYMSPEQATGDRTLDPRSDVYSLGAVLYEMLAGEPPHSGASVQTVIAKLLTERPTPLRVLRSTVPEGIDIAVQMALAKIPGDRFATAHAFAEALTDPAVSGARSAALPGSRPRRWLVAGVGGLALVLLVAWIAGRRAMFAPAVAEPGADPRHIAVLYFRSLTGDLLVPLADGLTEGLIRELARVPALRVVSPNGVLPFRDARVAQDSIARALDVGTIVEGSVAGVGSTLRVSVALVDATTSNVLGSASFEQPPDQVLALQDSVVSSVALFLRQRLGEEIALREDRRRTRSAEAWRLLLDARTAARGIDPLRLAGDTAAARRELMRADALLERASALDRNWGTPFVERARLADRALDLIGGFEGRYYDEWTERGLQHVAAALATQADDAEALTLRANFRYQRNVYNLGASPQAVAALGDSAERDMRAAVAADPNQAQAWTLLSHRLMRQGETAEAKLAALRAYESDPYAREARTILWRLYSASLDLEDRVEATRWCDEGKRRFPESPVFVECQITVQALAGARPDVPAMWRLLDRNVSLYGPADQEYRRRRGQLLVAMTLLRAGLPDSARAVALRARTDASADPSRDLVYIEMMLRNLLGDRDEAVRLAAQYYAANPQARSDCGSDGKGNVDRTWWMRGLVDDPRYLALSCTGR